MEWDELKATWKKDNPEDVRLPSDLSKWVMERISSSRKRLFRNVSLELGFVILIYAVMIVVLILWKREPPMFFYKTILVITLLAIPIAVRLLQSLQKITHEDLSVPLTTHLEEGIRHFRRTIMVYKISSYGGLVILVVVYINDEYFLQLSWPWEAGILLYLLFFAWMTAPYLRWFYGKQIHEIENMLSQLKQNGVV